jgi:tRNA (guanine37-N1)-methyltransferase
MKFKIITLFPELVSQVLSHGILSQALKKNLFEVETINPREFATDVHRTVDDRPFGGGDGMLMQAEVVRKSIEKAKTAAPEAPVIFLSPQGQTVSEKKVQELSKHNTLILLTARYGGIDQRLINDLVDEEVSIGDFVLSGGEIPALVLVDAIARKIPGVLGHHESAEKDSFADGLLEAPMFTRPKEWNEQIVPEVLLGGNHAEIEEWRMMMSWLVTLKKRPDLFRKAYFELKSELRGDHVSKLQNFYKNRSEAELAVCDLAPFQDGIIEEVLGGR